VGHHARVVQREVWKLFRRRSKQEGETPVQPQEVDVRNGIRANRPAVSEPTVGNAPKLVRVLEALPARGMQPGRGKGHPGQRPRISLDIVTGSSSASGKRFARK